MMGGAGIIRLADYADEAHLGAFLECAGPLAAQGGTVSRPSAVAPARRSWAVCDTARPSEDV